MIKIKALIRQAGFLGATALMLPALLIGNPVKADEGQIALGGKIYDKWFKVIKAPKPADTHMSWPKSNTKKKGNATHRCKSCHGWDYSGKDGAYASGSYKTGITGVRKYAGGDAAQVVAVMKDKTHGYAGKMDDATMMTVAMFVTKGQIDMDKYIDRKTKKSMGNAAKGKEFYGTLCVNCHGADGKLPKEMPPLGKLSNKNPWEMMHKILNGQPGEAMPALRALPFSVTSDVTAYLQTLPKK
jgi:cytochrome c553